MHNLFDSIHNASFRTDHNSRGMAGKPAEDEDLFEDPENWQRMFSEKRNQYYFFNHETEEVEWIEDNQSHPRDHQQPPVGSFLLGDVPARGTLVHQGDGIRDTLEYQP